MLQQGVSGFVAKRNFGLRKKQTPGKCLASLVQKSGWKASFVEEIQKGLPENNFKYISYMFILK